MRSFYLGCPLEEVEEKKAAKGELNRDQRHENAVIEYLCRCGEHTERQEFLLKEIGKIAKLVSMLFGGWFPWKESSKKGSLTLKTTR